jgi:type III pantothenate kinase
MNLIIDIGNSFSKINIFDENTIIDSSSVKILNCEYIANLKKEHINLKKVIVSSVKIFPVELKLYMQQNFDKFIELNYKTPLPIENFYNTKETLGYDRLAAAVGAFYLYPDSNTLIIDAGTAITFDFINEKNQYLGGKISPGLEMRFDALHQFTAKLPRVKNRNFEALFGKTTEESILSGVQKGIIYETDRTIDLFKDFYTNLKVIITGGDAIFFEKKLKNSFFVNLNLTALGLNHILEYNGEI